MTLEDVLIPLLKFRCPRVFTPVAPVGTETPYVTWQHVGGQSINFTENTLASERNAFIQVTVWAGSAGAAFALLRRLQSDLMHAPEPSFVAQPIEEPSDVIDEGLIVSGATQVFSVWGNR